MDGAQVKDQAELLRALMTQAAQDQRKQGRREGFLHGIGPDFRFVRSRSMRLNVLLDVENTKPGPC